MSVRRGVPGIFVDSSLDSSIARRHAIAAASSQCLIRAGGTGYAFDELPVVGDWGRRPLELATLRLQNMIGVSLANWDALRPADDQLAVLTQLGGLAIGDGAGGLLYEWKDPGICAVCNFEDALDALDGKTV